MKKSDLYNAFIAQAPDRHTASIKAAELGIKPPRKLSLAKRDNPEERLQIECVEYLRNFPDILFWHTANQMYRGNKANSGAFSAYINKLKMCGFLPGVPDLTLIFRNKFDITTLAFAELKSERGITSEAQKTFLRKAFDLGCKIAVVHSLDELRLFLKRCGHSRH